MSKRKIFTVILICILASLVIVVPVCGEINFNNYRLQTNEIEYTDFNISAKNVIMMIGDGMGPTHIKVAKSYFDRESLFMETYATTNGKIVTRSNNKIVTDSAAAATALACGVKTNNGNIGSLDNKYLENISEYAKSKGMGVGIIATETLKGATPAGFSVHNNDRNNAKQITDSQIASNIDLYIGSGSEYYADFQSNFSAAGINYSSDYNSLQETVDKLEKGTTYTRIWGAVDELEQPGNYNYLADVVELAIRYLTKFYGEEGFFLMVEESHIDKCSHSNDLDGMVKHLLALDIAVKRTVEWAQNDENTYVFLTADHETGNLYYDGTQELNNKLYHSGSHTSTNVNFYCYYKNASSVLYRGICIDNTDVAKINKKLIENYRK